MTKAQLDAFLVDYKALIIKHNMCVSACSCCPPHVAPLDDVDDIAAAAYDEIAGLDVEHFTDAD